MDENWFGLYLGKKLKPPSLIIFCTHMKNKDSFFSLSVIASWKLKYPYQGRFTKVFSLVHRKLDFKYSECTQFQNLLGLMPTYIINHKTHVKKI